MPYASREKRIKLIRNKKEIRIIGIDDGPFNPFKTGANVVVVGAIYRAGDFDGMMTTKIRCDGFNSTIKLINMITKSRYHEQLHYILINGITLGGFNVVDINKLNEATGLPALAIMRKYPDMKAINHAIYKLTGADKRWKLILKAGEIYRFNKIFFQTAGMDREEACLLLKLLCIRSNIPEPLRAAHIIAGALITGEGGRRP